uniref:Uncharacterized protein n=1 Tax=Rhizophora mucronata TaxID=61149 RepID=A0A2P2PRL6_RHIMU
MHFEFFARTPSNHPIFSAALHLYLGELCHQQLLERQFLLFQPSRYPPTYLNQILTP